MDLLNMLTGLLTSSSSVDALSAKAGTDSGQTKGIISTALPLLFGALTNNASTESGASSLFGALQQHTNTASIEDQIANADAEDGSKIIGHILGSKQKDVVQQISEKTGADSTQISNLLNNLAPGMMSGISAAAKVQQQQARKEMKAAKVVTGAAAVAAAKEAKEETKEAAIKAAKVVTGAKAVAAAKEAKQETQEAAVKAAKVVTGAKAVAAAKEAKQETQEAAVKAAKVVTGAKAVAAVKEAKEAVETKEPEVKEENAGLDLSGLMGLFGGSGSSGSGGGLGDLLGGFLGGGQDKNDNDSNPLLGMLMNFMK